MSRSGYVDDCEGWDLIRWRGAVQSAIRGKRGQALLKEMAAALDAMPNKTLIAGEMESEGQHCALGVVGAARGIEMSRLDVYDRDRVAQAFDIAGALAAEIAFINDDGDWRHDTPAERWRRVRAWVAAQIKGASDGRA